MVIRIVCRTAVAMTAASAMIEAHRKQQIPPVTTTNVTPIATMPTHRRLSDYYPTIFCDVRNVGEVIANTTHKLNSAVTIPYLVTIFDRFFERLLSLTIALPF